MTQSLSYDGGAMTYALNGQDISVDVSAGPLSETADALEWQGSGSTPVERIAGPVTNEITLTIRMNGITWPLIRPLIRTIPKPTATLTLGYPWGESEDLTVQAREKDPTVEVGEIMEMDVTFDVQGALSDT